MLGLGCSDASSDRAALGAVAMPPMGSGANGPPAGNVDGLPSAGGASGTPEGASDLPLDGEGAVGAQPPNPDGTPSERPLSPPDGFARNPIVSNVYTADPSAHVFEGRVFVYTSHDPDEQMGYDMTDYNAFSSLWTQFVQQMNTAIYS